MRQNSNKSLLGGRAELEQLINLELYPMDETGLDSYRTLIATIRDQLARKGCAVVKNFIHPEAREVMAREVLGVSHLAYDKIERVNVYNTNVDGDYPVDHPASIEMTRGNAFVARDQIPTDTVIATLYSSRLFQEFIAQCFGKGPIYELADPFAGLCVNVLRPGMEHPWHFDTNEFTVSLLAKAAQSGGVFEYNANTRSQNSENLAEVRNVMTDANCDQVQRLNLRPGDLQLFKGRYSLHRVTRVDGSEERHSVIFAYSEKPGVIGTAERTQQLFGRIHPEHLAMKDHPVRTDQLLD